MIRPTLAALAAIAFFVGLSHLHFEYGSLVRYTIGGKIAHLPGWSRGMWFCACLAAMTPAVLAASPGLGKLLIGLLAIVASISIWVLTGY